MGACLESLSAPKQLDEEEDDEFVPNPNNPVATFETTIGSFKAELFLDKVPYTASNFIALAQSGFYNGLHVHRVVRERASCILTLNML